MLMGLHHPPTHCYRRCARLYIRCAGRSWDAESRNADAEAMKKKRRGKGGLVVGFSPQREDHATWGLKRERG